VVVLFGEVELQGAEWAAIGEEEGGDVAGNWGVGGVGDEGGEGVEADEGVKDGEAGFGERSREIHKRILDRVPKHLMKCAAPLEFSLLLRRVLAQVDKNETYKWHQVPNHGMRHKLGVWRSWPWKNGHLDGNTKPQKSPPPQEARHSPIATKKWMYLNKSANKLRDCGG